MTWMFPSLNRMTTCNRNSTSDWVVSVTQSFVHYKNFDDCRCSAELNEQSCRKFSAALALECRLNNHASSRVWIAIRQGDMSRNIWTGWTCTIMSVLHYLRSLVKLYSTRRNVELWILCSALFVCSGVFRGGGPLGEGPPLWLWHPVARRATPESASTISQSNTIISIRISAASH